MTTDRLDPIDLMVVGVDDFSQLVNQQGEQERVEVAFYLCFLLLILCIFFFIHAFLSRLQHPCSVSISDARV